VSGATHRTPNLLDVYHKRLVDNPFDSAAIFKIIDILKQFLSGKIHNNETAYSRLTNIIDSNDLLSADGEIVYSDRLNNNYDEIEVFYDKYRNKSIRQRYVDFNQGIDARLLTKAKAKKLSEISIRPLRIAFDSVKLTKQYVAAVRNATESGITNLSNYILYNYDDKPIDLYKRLELNIKLNQELGAKIYSFPMKYIPVTHTNRNEHYANGWNKKYVRAIQAVLNVTKGSVAPGESFFYRAFGANEDEFFKILLMPEDYIINRIPSENLGYTQDWWSTYTSLSADQKQQADKIILSNDFTLGSEQYLDDKVTKVLEHYKQTKFK
jgi:hypothetical protein